MNDQQPQYDCSKVCFHVGPTTTEPRVGFPQVPLVPTLKQPLSRPDCVIYRDKPLPRQAFWRPAQQAPPVWLPPRSAPPENVWVSMTPAPSPPFPLPPKSAPSTRALVARVLVIGALLLCFLARKATEPSAPRAQLVKLPPQLIMPDHSIVKVSYRGELASETLLPQPVPPTTPNRLGDTFLV
jgi:hypothetical protein